MSCIEAHDQVRQRVRTLFTYLEDQKHGNYNGEAVSQLQHSLQCADFAVKAGSDNDTILACLLHDVGRFVPSAKNVPPLIAPGGGYIGRESHEKLGAHYLREFGFSDKICALVGSHVAAKRYLTAIDREYYDTLSPAILVAQNDPLLEEKLSLRKWDDLAKNPNLVVPDIVAYEDMAIESLLQQPTITVHSRTYNVPRKTTVVVCVDGFDVEYLDQGIKDGILPTFKRFLAHGYAAHGKSAMPSFTIPNNLSIITGAPTRKHGIAGNYIYDKATRAEEMVFDDSHVTGPTILSKLSDMGKKIVVVTAKDKLRKILQHELAPDSVCFSTEKLDQCSLTDHGIEHVAEWLGDPPSMYSAELSLRVLEAGLHMLRQKMGDVYYLTLSDYVQHKHAPGTKESNDFFSKMDSLLKSILDEGAVIGITGDHGMSDKCLPNGELNVLYLQDILDKTYGQGSCRVICPITDPFVHHHGALGSFVRVYMYANTPIAEVLALIRSLDQVEYASEGAEAAQLLEMPTNNEGDIVVVAKKHAVIGSVAAEHDLSGLHGRLRSHGGFSEQTVPLIVSHKCTGDPDRPFLRNYDIFHLVLNEAEV